jgi:hypothetical protein
MTFKLLKTAQRTWHRIDAPDFLPLVRAGGVFKDGLPGEGTESQAEKNTGRVAA